HVAPRGGPVAGILTCSNGSELRATLCAPGAYQFSAPLPLPEAATRVHPAPGRDYALVERAASAATSETPPGIARFNGGAIESFTGLEDAVASPDWVFFSAEGGAVFLSSAGSN